MAKVFALNYTDTAIDGVTALAFAERGLINFGANFRKKNGSNGNSDLLLTNISSPYGCAERFRYSFSEVANIYNGSSVEPSYYAPTKKGASLLVQLNEVWTETDDADPTYRIDLPVQAHIVLKIPQNSLITAARVQALVGRLLSGLYDTGVETTTRIDALIRGSLEPSDL